MTLPELRVCNLLLLFFHFKLVRVTSRATVEPGFNAYLCFIMSLVGFLPVVSDSYSFQDKI